MWYTLEEGVDDELPVDRPGEGGCGEQPVVRQVERFHIALGARERFIRNRPRRAWR